MLLREISINYIKHNIIKSLDLIKYLFQNKKKL